MNALQSGSGVHIKPTSAQRGGFLGTLLASIGVPLLLNALTGKGVGKGAPRIGRMPRSVPVTSSKRRGGAAPRLGALVPPPFYGNWNKTTTGYGKKRPKKEKGYFLDQTVHSKEFP